MPRSVTVTFEDGTSHVYENVPDDTSPNQVEARAVKDFPNQRITQVMGGDIMLRELRDAIGSRQATIDDLRAIADRYGRNIPNEDAAQAWLDYAEANPTVQIPDDVATPPTSRTAAVLSGMERGLKPIGEFADRLNPLSYLVDFAEDALRPGAREQREAAIENAMATQATRAEAQRPNYFTGGQIAGEVLGTAPLIFTGGGAIAGAGGLVGRQTPRTLQAFGRAIQTGGTGVRAPSRAAVASGAPIAASRTGRMGLRVAGGATAGMGAAALTDQDLTDAALGGAIVPVVGTIARRGAGRVYDQLRGRMGDIRAAEILRNLISENSTAIMNALRNAPADARTNTAQFLAERGLLTPEMAAATRIAEASDVGKPLETVALARGAGREEQLASLRGGGTQTEAVENVNAMRQAVRDEAEPMLADTMRRADIGRTQILPAERAAAASRKTAAEESRRAAGFYRAADEQAMALNQMDDLGDPLDIEAINRQRGLVGSLEARGLEIGQRSVDAGAEARRAQAVADGLRAQGYAPIDIAPVVGRMRELAREALPNSPRRTLFSRFADMLEQRAAETGGVIDGAGLHLAKREMNEFVSSVLGQTDPSAIKRGTSMMLGSAGKLINDAIDEAAGPGTPFADYNRVFSEGMRGVEVQDFARELTALTPARFEKVMRGDDPDFVRQHLPNDFDINSVFSPEQLAAAQRLNREISADLDVASLGLRVLPRELRGSLGTGARNRVMDAFQPGLKNTFARAISRIAASTPRISGNGVAADQLAREYSQIVSENAMRSLAPALASAPRAAQLAGVRSTNYMTGRAVENMNPAIQQALAQTAQQYLTQPAPANVLPSQEFIPEGEVFLGYGVTADGQEYPLYGPAVRSAGNR